LNRKVGTWFEMEESNVPSYLASVCVYENKYLYKFGGYKDTNTPNNTIERYHISDNIWEVVDYKSKLTFDNVDLPSCSSSVQLNPSQIIVFGGVLKNSTKSNMAIILEVDDKLGQGEDRHLVKNKLKYNLPVKEAFCDPQAVIHEGKIFVLQNHDVPNMPDSVRMDTRRLLCFDGFEWKILIE